MRPIALFVIITFISCYQSDPNKVLNKHDNRVSEDSTLGNTYMTEVLLDLQHKINIKTKVIQGDKISNRSKKTIQEVFFYNFDSIVKILYIDSLHFIENDNLLIGNHQLTEVGIDSIRGDKFYSLYFYLANGESEFYLFYDSGGHLLFLQECKGVECTVNAPNYDKNKAYSYLNDENRTIIFRDVLGVVLH